MDRNINLLSYTSDVLNEYSDFKAILNTESNEFNNMQSYKNKLIINAFIDEAEEYGIRRFEKMLKIYPTEDDTLETRRFRVKSRWNNSSATSLIEVLISLCGSDYSIEYVKGKFIINIETHLGTYGTLEELIYIINKMIPSNIVINIKNTLKFNSTATINIATVNSEYKTYNLTCDFEEKYEISGECDLESVLQNMTIYEIN